MLAVVRASWSARFVDFLAVSSDPKTVDRGAMLQWLQGKLGRGASSTGAAAAPAPVLSRWRDPSEIQVPDVAVPTARGIVDTLEIDDEEDG